jgi:hypothetical protein
MDRGERERLQVREETQASRNKKHLHDSEWTGRYVWIGRTVNRID